MVDKLTPEQLAVDLNNLSPEVLKLAQEYATLAQRHAPEGSTAQATAVIQGQKTTVMNSVAALLRTEVIAAIEAGTPPKPGEPPTIPEGPMKNAMAELTTKDAAGNHTVDAPAMGDMLARQADKAALPRFQKEIGDAMMPVIMMSLNGVDPAKLVLPPPAPPAPPAPPGLPPK